MFSWSQKLAWECSVSVRSWLGSIYLESEPGFGVFSWSQELTSNGVVSCFPVGVMVVVLWGEGGGRNRGGHGWVWTEKMQNRELDNSWIESGGCILWRGERKEWDHCCDYLSRVASHTRMSTLWRTLTEPVAWFPAIKPLNWPSSTAAGRSFLSWHHTFLNFHAVLFLIFFSDSLFFLVFFHPAITAKTDWA